jgi:hypothetical protein
MKRLALVLLTGALFGWSAAAQSQPNTQAGASADSKTSVQADKSGAQMSSNMSNSTSAQTGPKSASLASGTAVQAVLTGSLDAKKNKPGDAVAAKTTKAVKSQGKVIIPRGSKLVGHVTEAKTRAKGESESALGIVFDKAILRNGQEVPLNVTIQALAAAETETSSTLGDDSLASGSSAVASGATSGRGALGGVTSSAGGAVGAATNTATNVRGTTDGALSSTANTAGSATGAVGGLNAAGQLNPNSSGVFGLNGLNLNSVTSNSTQGSLITSTGKTVHLESGTQMLLVAQSQAQAVARPAPR